MYTLAERGIKEKNTEYVALDISVDAVWSQWSSWSSCSATCNGGTMVRNRTCSEPMHGGRDCTGHDREVTVCGMDLCPTGKRNFEKISIFTS